jgi:hypothetical protein
MRTLFDLLRTFFVTLETAVGTAKATFDYHVITAEVVEAKLNDDMPNDTYSG